jgi:hypothetical protein
VGTAACPGTAEFRPCAPQAKFYRFVFFLRKKKFFIGSILGLFDDLVESTLLAGGKSKKKSGNLGDPARAG